MTFDDFIAPLSVAEFYSNYWNKKPVLIPSSNARRVKFDWNDFNNLFEVRSHWTENNVKLILNSRAVSPDFYMENSAIRVANIGQVQNFLAMGASLVVDAVEQISPGVRQITDMLARKFGGSAGANYYASFKGVQAFASHYDTHEVFALHCEGEKRWRIYQNRADNALNIPTGEDAQQRIDAAKGPVLMDIVMRPGDLLYIPRGYFHDAMATDEASLHLTFGFRPLLAQSLFRLLENVALEDSRFREYLPLAGEDRPAFEAKLSDIAKALVDLIENERFRNMLEVEQIRYTRQSSPVNLPHRPALHFYARTSTAVKKIDGRDGAFLKIAGNEVTLGLLGEVADYILERPAFSLEELGAKFAYHPTSEIAMLVSELERQGAVAAYQPSVI